MLARNILFVSVVIGVGIALRASLFPLSTDARKVKFDSGPTRNDEFRLVVQQVDTAFRNEWDSKGIVPAQRADDLAVARRLSLGLAGTVPSLEEIRQFEAQPPESRIDGWANHLLNDRRFADYFAERMARAYVGTEDGPVIAYRKRRYTAWLSDQFLRNTPYSEVVRQMIAAQGLNTDKPAVNFIAATFDENKKAPDPEKLAIRVTRAFLGLRIDCAQCHDHFLEPAWKQTHFQSLAAFFGQTKHTVTNIADSGEGEYSFEDRVAGGTHEIAPSVPFLPELLPSQGTRREQLAAWVTHPRNLHFSRATVNRVWAMMFGRPLLKRIEAQSLDERIPPALDILATDFSTHGHDLKRLILLIASTEAFRLDSAAMFEITESHEESLAVFPMTRLRPEQVIGNVIQAASVTTINQKSHVFTRMKRYFNERDFVQRYGDADDDSFAKTTSTIPQRLLIMNGDLVDGKAKEELLNASSQIAMFAPDNGAAIDTAYLTVLTRRPTAEERTHFAAKLANAEGDVRKSRIADLYWVLFNSTEISWNH
ncbi:MAG: DUF1549 domain-containing protein [Gemmataceae bacterium]